MGINILGIPEYKEKSYRTIYIINAILITMCVYGAITYMYTALDIEYYGIIMFPLIAISALISAFMHKRRLYMVGGYFVLIAGFLIFTIIFFVFINSGFSHLMNVIYKLIDTRYNLELMREFNEAIDNSQLAVTFTGIAIGWVFCIVVNIIISEYMSFLGVLMIELMFMITPMYLGREPKLLPLLLVITTPIIVLMMNATHKYCFKDKSTSYMDRKKLFSKKNNYETKYNSKGYYKCRVMPTAVGKQGVVSMIFVVPLLVLVSIILPRSFTDGRNNIVEENTKTFVQNIAVYGFEGLFDFGKSEGGLGMDGTIRDGNITGFNDTEMYKVECAPVNYDRILMPAFVGTVYTGNNWKSSMYIKSITVGENSLVAYDYGNDELTDTYVNTSKIFEAVKDDEILAGKMVINIGSYMSTIPRQLILPYYYSGIEGGLGGTESSFGMVSAKGTMTITYYPCESNLIYDVLKDEDLVENMDEYILIDEKMYTNNSNYISDVMREFIEEYNLEYNRKNDRISDYEERMRVVERIMEIFEEDYVYTLRPGKTPKSKTYEKYFLLDNKKGYCAHFATATVLILRELGIPARYVEGYAIDPGYTDYTVKDGKGSIDEWIWGEGSSKATQVVEYSVTDRCGHAWTEMYIEGVGWIPVDTTPGSDEEEEDGGSGFGSALENIANVAGNAAQGVSKRIDFIKQNKVAFAVGVLLVVVLIVLGWVSSILICRKIRKKKFYGEDLEKAIMAIAEYARRLLAFAGYPTRNVYTFKECAVKAMEDGKIDLSHAITILEPTQKYVYGEYMPTQEERNQAIEAVKQISEMIYKDQSRFKKFVFVAVKRFTP